MPLVTRNIKDTVVKAIDVFNWLTNHAKSRSRFSHIALQFKSSHQAATLRMSLLFHPWPFGLSGHVVL